MLAAPLKTQRGYTRPWMYSVSEEIVASCS
jgi:hypothetical protein